MQLHRGLSESKAWKGLTHIGEILIAEETARRVLRTTNVPFALKVSPLANCFVDFISQRRSNRRLLKFGIF